MLKLGRYPSQKIQSSHLKASETWLFRSLSGSVNIVKQLGGKESVVEFTSLCCQRSAESQKSKPY